MSKLTPSQVKNTIRRGLRGLVDPEPESLERQKAIIFFNNNCAYCGVSIEAGKGDLDHLLSAAQGGRNHISNRVFSCKPCNAEQKRDRDWEVFLLEKHGPGPAFEAAHQKIQAWVIAAGAFLPLPTATLDILEEESRKVTAAYEEACKRIRGQSLLSG